MWRESWQSISCYRPTPRPSSAKSFRPRHGMSLKMAERLTKSGPACTRIREAFEFTDARARTVFNDAAREKVYRETLVAAIADGEVAQAERGQLDRFAAELELSPEDSLRLYKEEATRALQMFFNHVTANKQSSAIKRKTAESNRARFPPVLPLSTTHRRSKCWSVFVCSDKLNRGRFPIVQPGILLARGETCHFRADNIVQKEIRTVTKRVDYRGLLSSIKIMKGVRYRVGSIAPQRVTQDVMLEIDSGSMFLTRKHARVDPGHTQEDQHRAAQTNTFYDLQRRTAVAEGHW